ncbi:zinc finger protein OZF [Aedes aegypti]|uniref:Uncharacterized protein n=1 Tax=Aedes aegypti TaxID=7159 RepID=A0A1S4F209_AEDAE|nr:zinc finger protein OZF [Aedes aegypti]
MEPFESTTHMCRLCLRKYNVKQMVHVFAKEHELDQAIYEAVSIKMYQLDAMASICNNCQTIIQIINCFREACQKSDTILKNGTTTLDSNAWSSSYATNVFHLTEKLIKTHQKDMDFLYKNHISLKEQAAASEFIVQYIKEEEHIEINDYGPGQDEPDYLDSTVPEDTVVTDDNISRTQDLTESDSEASNKRKRKKKSENQQEKVVCSTCGEMVPHKGLEGHMNRHLGVRPFPCNVAGCDAKLYSKFSLQQHRSRHKSSNRYFDCEVCGKRIKGNAYWLVHKRIHEEEPKYSCDICGKKFHRKFKLKDHSTVHSGIADYSCELCGKFFTVKHNLTAHYQRHKKNGTYPDGFEPNASVNA